MTKDNKEESWEDNLLAKISAGHFGRPIYIDELIAFIRQELSNSLSSYRTRLRESATELKKKAPPYSEQVRTWNVAIDKILDLLDRDKEN